MNWCKKLKPKLAFNFKKFFYLKLKEIEGNIANILSLEDVRLLSKKFELEINNIFTSSYASTSTYGNELSTTLTFRPSDSSGLKTYFEYENDYKEFSNPKFKDKYSLNIGYDF